MSAAMMGFSFASTHPIKSFQSNRNHHPHHSDSRSSKTTRTRSQRNHRTGKATSGKNDFRRCFLIITKYKEDSHES